MELCVNFSFAYTTSKSNMLPVFSSKSLNCYAYEKYECAVWQVKTKSKTYYVQMDAHLQTIGIDDVLLFLLKRYRKLVSMNIIHIKMVCRKNILAKMVNRK